LTIQRLLKLKQEQDKALVEEKRLKEEEARNKIKEEQKYLYNNCYDTDFLD
jgi:hypothetical protein